MKKNDPKVLENAMSYGFTDPENGRKKIEEVVKSENCELLTDA